MLVVENMLGQNRRGHPPKGTLPRNDRMFVPQHKGENLLPPWHGLELSLPYKIIMCSFHKRPGEIESFFRQPRDEVSANVG